MHLDDPRMDPILRKLADLGLPINVHMGDPQWMYEPMDASNDLLFEALFFRRDDKKDDKDLAGMLQVLENAVVGADRDYRGAQFSAGGSVINSQVSP